MQSVAAVHSAQQDRETRLRTDLAHIVKELHRREKQHRIAEEEAERVTRSVILEENSCRNIACELRHVREHRQEIASLLKEEQTLISSEQVEAQQAQITLSRVNDNTECHTIDVAALRSELQRVVEMVGSVGQHLANTSQEITRFEFDTRVAENELSKQRLLRDEQRTRVRAIDVEVQTFRHAAANEAGLFAAAMAKAARIDLGRQEARSEEDLRVLQLRETCAILQDEVSSSEQELMELREPSNASIVQLEVHREQQRSQEFIRERTNKCHELKEHLEHALLNAEETLQQSRTKFNHVEQKLQQQQLAVRLASDQDALGKYIVEELSLELAENRCKEKIGAQEESAMSRRMSREQCISTQLEAAIDRLVGETSDMTQHIPDAYVLRSVYDADAAKLNAARAELSELWVNERKEQHMLLECKTEAATHHEALQSLRTELADSHREEDVAMNNLKVKQKMVKHSRDRLEDMKLDARRTEVSEKDDERAYHECATQREATVDALRQKVSSVESIVRDVHEESLEVAEAARRKDEIIDIMEVNLSQVTRYATMKEDEAREQVQRLQEEGQKLLRHAKHKREEMEQEFLAESGSRVKAHKALQAELAEVRQRLQNAPAELKEHRRRIAEERSRSASRVALMLAGFKSSEG